VFRCFPLFLVSLLLGRGPRSGRIDCNALQSHILVEIATTALCWPPGMTPQLQPLAGIIRCFIFCTDSAITNVLFKGGGWDLIEDLRQKRTNLRFLVVVPEGERSFYTTPPMARTLQRFLYRSSCLTLSRVTRFAAERSARANHGGRWADRCAALCIWRIPSYFSFGQCARVPALHLTIAATELRLCRMLTPLRAAAGIGVRQFRRSPSWNQNSPFVLAKRNRASIRTTKLIHLLNCGREDEFGFDQGAKELHRQLQEEGIEHEISPLSRQPRPPGIF